MDSNKIYSLFSVTRSVERVIENHCSTVIWIKAEIVRLNHYPQTGHCYPELVEKRNGKIIAEIKGNIWKDNHIKIRRKFKEVLNEELADDMKVVAQAQLTFHPVYGLALNILDIDPAYTLGELARQKMGSIARLKQEGIYDLNRQKSLPHLPKTLALISVDSSKGYQDFLSIIGGNPWGYQFHHLLFPAILQGDRAVKTIVSQLRRIRDFHEIFDAVIILRGGGGEVGLSCYDSYELAREIAAFPLPVLTGIGHSTNQTVTEVVSHQSFITPTKIAEFLIQKFHEFFRSLESCASRMGAASALLIERQRNFLDNYSEKIRYLSQRSLEDAKRDLEDFRMKGYREVQNMLRTEKEFLDQTAGRIQLLSPENVLKRGYSITRRNGKAISNPADLKPGDVIETEYLIGRSTATVSRIDVEK